MDVRVRSAEQVELDQLQSALGFLLRIAQLKVFQQYFMQPGEDRLKPGEFSVLWVIKCNPGIRQSLLCQRLMIKRAHMTKLIRALEERGWVARRIPDEDRRGVELTLTAEGEAAVGDAAEGFFAFENTVGSELNASEREQLMVLLRKLVNIKGSGL